MIFFMKHSPFPSRQTIRRKMAHLVPGRRADAAAPETGTGSGSGKRSRRGKKQKSVSAATAGAVAAVTAAGFLVGGAYNSPNELMTDGRGVIVQTLDTAEKLDDAPADGPGADTAQESTLPEDEKKRGVHAAVRKAVRATPVGVRALVGLPLWALGTAGISLASPLLSSLLSPVLAAVLRWLAAALLALLVFTLTAKTLFPDLPLKKILNRRSVLSIGLLCLLFGLADALLPYFWDDYRSVAGVLRVIGSFLCAAVPVAFFVRRRQKKRKLEEITAEPVMPPEAPAPEESMEQKEAAARALVEDLADSVSQKTR